MPPRKYLIWSIEHKAWWKPNSLGYTCYYTEAGKYSLEEAEEICQGANWLSPSIPDAYRLYECIVPDFITEKL
jgi:hypothetical protein